MFIEGGFIWVGEEEVLSYFFFVVVEFYFEMDVLMVQG